MGFTNCGYCMKGTTTQQMLKAPQGAIYIWPSRTSIGYAKDLAMHLGRHDLKIESVGYLDTSHRFHGARGVTVVLDHAVCDLSHAAVRNLDELDYMNARYAK